MKINPVQIDGRLVGPGHPCLVVGEVAQAHDGSLGMAHAFIDAIAKAGADAVKFQTHIAEAESSALEPFRVKFSQQDATRYEYWKRMEFSEEQWFGLAEHARQKGLIFLSSPFSEAAVELLKRVGMPAWKIASGEVTNPLLFDSLASTGLPVLLSTGMSPLAEIDEKVAWVQGRGLPLAVFQCTSAYPCPPESVGLNMLPLFQKRYRVPVGLSDHTGTIYSGLAAASLGASMLEVHVTLSREMFGPDVPASLTPSELSQLLEGVRFIERAMQQPVDKTQLSPNMVTLRKVFGKSLVAGQDLKAGTPLRREALTARKPGTGIPAAKIEAVIGLVPKRDIRKGEFLRETDFEQTGEVD